MWKKRLSQCRFLSVSYSYQHGYSIRKESILKIFKLHCCKIRITRVWYGNIWMDKVLWFMERTYYVTSRYLMVFATIVKHNVSLITFIGFIIWVYRSYWIFLLKLVSCYHAEGVFQFFYLNLYPDTMLKVIFSCRSSSAVGFLW